MSLARISQVVWLLTPKQDEPNKNEISSKLGLPARISPASAPACPPGGWARTRRTRGPPPGSRG